MRGPVAPVLTIPCLEQIFDESQKAVIVDLLTENRQQDIMVDVVETSLDISFDEPLGAFAVAGDIPQRSMAATSRPKTVTMVRKLCFVVGFQQEPDDFLYQFV